MAIDYESIIKNEADSKVMRAQIAAGIGQAQDTADTAVDIANQSKNTASNANNRVEDIIASNGSAESTEVIAGRHDNINNVTYDNLGKRLDANSASLADRLKEMEVA